MATGIVTDLCCGGRCVSIPSLILHLTFLIQEFAPHFPVIARMARDVLAIPGPSVTVEHLFSKSRHSCPEVRGSMKAETIMGAMLTKMWINAGYLDY
jgi:hypothetical protein